MRIERWKPEEVEIPEDPEIRRRRWQSQTWTLLDLEKETGCEVIVKERGPNVSECLNPDCKFIAYLPEVWVMENGCVVSSDGVGDVPEEALLDLAAKLDGRKLVSDPFGSCRKEFAPRHYVWEGSTVEESVGAVDQTLLTCPRCGREYAADRGVHAAV